MTTIHLTKDDLTKTRFAYRPLLEIPLSYRVLINPEFQFPHRRWVEETYRAMHGLQLPHLDALIIDHGYIPDFLTPTPMINSVDIEADFAVVLATPDDLIRKNVQELMEMDGENEVRRFFMAHPREAVHCLVDEMRLYWQRNLAQTWSRMISMLEGDLIYRGRLLALDGPPTLFEDLHPTITCQRDQIHISPACNHAHCSEEAMLHGDGIQLVPTVFTGCGRLLQLTPEWHPMIAYSARGAGLYCRETRASQPLELALGTGRARVLQALTTPASTGEVAYKTRISAATASQHLSRLTKAGLAEPRRSGKRVYYHLTRRGEELIALFERII